MCLIVTYCDYSRRIRCVLSALSLAVTIVDISISVFHESISTIYDHDKFDVAFFWISDRSLFMLGDRGGGRGGGNILEGSKFL